MNDFLQKNVVFSTNLEDIISASFSSNYVSHALCLKGSGSFRFFGKEMQIKEGDFMIFLNGKWLSDFSLSTDFQCISILVSSPIIQQNRPKSNYDIIGTMSLFKNPIMPLLEEEKEHCKDIIQLIYKRLQYKNHDFQTEMVGHLLSAFFLDLFHFHKRIHSEKIISEKKAVLMRNFLNLLETNEIETQREVQYFAEKLRVTPKYLSQVCKEISGQSPQIWIDRFAVIRIQQLLSQEKYSFSQISEMMNFSSLSYFSRYVKKHLGVSPSDFVLEN